MDRASFAARYDDLLSQPHHERLYGESGYYNVGYWVDGIIELAPACDRMVDELASAIPPHTRVILDVGCGLGATTLRLGATFPQAIVIGANLSTRQLRTARARGVASTVAMDAARLPVRTGTADVVVSIEAAQHFDTRADFFAEARRVLRPGGILALSDMLFRDREAVGSWMLPAANDVVTPDAYARLLDSSGFVDVSVRDVTAHSWRPFCAEMRRALNESEDNLRAVEDSLACYVIAVARVPRS